MRLADRRFGILALCALALLHGESARAQSAQELEGVEQELQQGAEKADALARKAAALDQEIKDLKKALVASAKAVQDAEQQVTAIEEKLEELEAKEAQSAGELAQRREELAEVLMALERLSSRPALAIFLGDTAPVAQARALRLLTIAGEDLLARAKALGQQLAELAALRTEVEMRRGDLAQSVAKLSDENANLAALMKKKSKLQASTLEESEATRQRLAKLSEQARNLKDLLDRLEAAKKREPAEEAEPVAQDGAPGAAEGEQTASLPEADSGSDGPPPGIEAFPSSGEFLIPPVRGKIAAGFGEATESLGKSTGLVFAARSGAEVVAPFDGQVVFEGPFRGYGQILILEHVGGYHSVLAGLGRADAKVGQWMSSGEPLGVMSEGPDAALYFELRQDGRPIDPAPFLSGKKEAAAQSN